MKTVNVWLDDRVGPLFGISHHHSDLADNDWVWVKDSGSFKELCYKIDSDKDRFGIVEFDHELNWSEENGTDCAIWFVDWIGKRPHLMSETFLVSGHSGYSERRLQVFDLWKKLSDNFNRSV